MHLDTILTMVDRDAFTIYPQIRNALVAFSLRPAAHGITAEREDDLFVAIARSLEVPRLRLFETGGDAYEAEREQWDDGNNVVALEPGWKTGVGWKNFSAILNDPLVRAPFVRIFIWTIVFAFWNFGESSSSSARSSKIAARGLKSKQFFWQPTQLSQ